MGRRNFSLIETAIQASINDLKLHGEKVDTGHWQGVPTEGKPDLITKEILDLSWSAPIPHQAYLIDAIEPNWPWCERHFLERVGRVPTNPGHEYKNWPWWRGQDEKAMIQVHQTSPEDFELRFSHTYQERFWPRNAGEGDSGPYRTYEGRDNWGIRYPYGDLDDVVDLLVREPYTRQAYLPIFFPEDTGAVHGGRIPCSLGYHFLLRDNQLHCWYDIRSCDAVRHFRDDLYLACRLTEWVLREVQSKDVQPGKSRAVWDKVVLGSLFFTAHSFHVHMGDHHEL